ncbi:MAG: MFS transporter [Spirochaetales bacterium]|nr:MFS transporter [Spirochaetales bacterium]
MKKYLTVVSSFLIMLCVGSIYAWSIIASELIAVYQFSAFQSQIIFGTVIAIFPVTMIFVGKLGQKIPHRYFGYISGILFFLGYLLASFSGGDFFLIFLGIGIIAGIATGFGYWVSLTVPVQWFPSKKGLITGIAAAGFGLGAVFMSEIFEIMLLRDFEILQILRIVGIAYGLVIFIFSALIYQLQDVCEDGEKEKLKVSEFVRKPIFSKLFIGIFLGTFAGLLIIGSLKIIGEQCGIEDHILVIGVALFAFANFLGRLVWGFASDHIGASLSLFLALFFQSISILSINIFTLSSFSYLLVVVLIGFCFGGNFVLFAKETSQIFGVANLGIVYPYIFVGYAIAGIAGPISGGVLYDITGSFFYPIILASLMSLIGCLLFLNQIIKEKKR